MQVKTDEKSFFKAMAREYGESSERNAKLQAEYMAVPTARRGEWLNFNAQRQVQSRSCAKYSMVKSKWGGR